MKRKQCTTRFREDDLKKIKILAVEKDKGVNDLLEEDIEWLLKKYEKHPKNIRSTITDGVCPEIDPIGPGSVTWEIANAFSAMFKRNRLTLDEARQKLALVLEQAENTGKVLIQRKDGRTFALVPQKAVSSPLDVPPIKAKITTQEIVDIVRAGRER
jgi:hypothetical protein